MEKRISDGKKGFDAAAALLGLAVFAFLFASCSSNTEDPQLGGSSPFMATKSIGPLSFKATISPNDNFGASAILTASQGTALVGMFQFIPSNPIWTLTNARIGTTTVSFITTFVPPSYLGAGSIRVDAMTVTPDGGGHQNFSGTVCSWTRDGTLTFP